MIIPLYVIKAKALAIYESIHRSPIDDDNEVLIQVADKLSLLIKEITDYIEKHEAPKEKELITEGMNLDEETIPRTKAWIVMEDALVAFTCNGKFHVTVDGNHLTEGKYLGKKIGEESTWYDWLKKRHEEEIKE